MASMLLLEFSRALRHTPDQESGGSVMLKTVFQAVAMAAAVLASTAAMAAVEDKMPDVRVYYGDLDLSSPAAVATLDHRLAHAIDAACPSGNGVREMSELHAVAACHAEKRAEIAPLRQAVLASAAHSPNVLAAVR